MTPEQWRDWLPTPQATRTINDLWPETEAERIAREQRESNDAIYTAAVRKFFQGTEPLR